MTLYVNQLQASAGTGTITVPANNILYSPGTILQVVSASSGPLRQTINTTSAVPIDGLSVTIYPKFPNSRIVVEAQITSTATYVSSFGIYKNDAAVTDTTGYTNSEEPNMAYTVYLGESAPDNIYSWPLLWSEVPNSTSPIKYTIMASSAWGGTATATYINNRSSNDMASFSHMIVTEFAQ